MQIARAVVDDGDVHGLTASGRARSPPLPSPLPLGAAMPALLGRSAGGCRSRPFSCSRQPGLKKGKLGGIAAARRSPCRFAGSPAARATPAQIVGLEGEQHDERDAQPRRTGSAPASSLGSNCPPKHGEKGDEQDELEPHALIEQPQPRHEQRRPGEALLDEDERPRPVPRVPRRAWRLINRIERHDTSLTVKAVGCARA